MPIAEKPLPPDAHPVMNISYLALGDSYTIGHGVDENERFPKLTTDLLSKVNIFTNDLQYLAVNGWTTFNLQNAISKATLQNTYTIVTLLIGVNDQYQGADTVTYSARFTELLRKSIELTAGDPSHVFVLSIPDYGVTPFVPAASKAKVSAGVDEFNNVNFEIARHYSCHYINVTGISRQVSADPAFLVSDELHPSGKQYRLWAEQLAPEIISALK